MDAARVARTWRRPYTSVQWAWVRALGVEPSREWADGGHARGRADRHRGWRRAMRQRYGVRGL